MSGKEALREALMDLVGRHLTDQTLMLLLVQVDDEYLASQQQA